MEYQTTEIVLSTPATQIDLLPKKIQSGTEWSIEPNFPAGVTLFTEDISVNGRLIDSNKNLVCVISSSEGILCVDSIDSGGSSHSALSIPIEDLYGNNTANFAPTSLAVGSKHVCSIMQYPDSNQMSCWGSNLHGQLATHEGILHHYPVNVSIPISGVFGHYYLEVLIHVAL